MSIRKFGTSDDQKVIADEKDSQGVRKEAKQDWTEQDQAELDYENEGGNGVHRS